MVLLWGSFRDQIRRSVLRDPDELNWSDDQLLDFCWWALDTLCAHTAQATAVSYPADAVEYSLPDNVFDEFLDTASVYYKTADSGAAPTYLKPVSSPGKAHCPGKGYFSEWPRGTLLLGEAPGDTYTLWVNYFAHYTRPVEDSDTIDVPQWMQLALSYLIAAYAYTGLSAESANIDRWKEKTDSGNPEHNALRRQEQFYMQRYENEIRRVHPQNRTMYWEER